MDGEVKNIYETLSLELKLLLACLRPQIAEKEQNPIDMLFAAPIDWDLLVHLAVYHGVLPLVYQYISTLKHVALPPEAISILRQKSRESTLKTLHMIGELVKVMRDMEENGIRVVVLKGFPLADKLYGNVALRPSQDLDILVWPKDMDKARRLIEAQGYERIYPSFAATPGQLRNWMKIQHHFMYWHKDKHITLEMHWQLGHHGMDIPLTYIEHSLTQVKIAGQLMHMLGTEELLLSLVLHGASHRWFSLKWLCDIGMMLRRGGFSWQRLYGLAESLGVETILNQAIILSRHLLAAPVPDGIIDMVNKDRKAQKLATMAIPFIIDFHSNFDQSIDLLSHYYKKKYGFYLQCGWRKKFAFIHHHFLPTDADIELIALPESLYFMYFLIRPFTWFKHQLAEIGGK